MNIERCSEQMWELLFSVRRSVRYHERREAFFWWTHRLTSFTCLLFGSTAVAAFAGKLGEDTGIVFAILVAVVSAADLVIGFAEKACLHNRLRCAFARLESRILTKPDDAQDADYVDERIRIEQDELPKYAALDLLCHNDIVIACYPPSDHKEHLHKVGLLQRYTANFFTWPWAVAAHAKNG